MTIASIGAPICRRIGVMSCLQAARIRRSRRIAWSCELDLTPGIAIADGLIAEIDRDRNGILSETEKRDYIARVRRDDRHDDRRPFAARRAGGRGLSRYGGAAKRRRRDPSSRRRSALPTLSNGAHQLTFRNRHRPDISVYLANALVPESDRIGITAQDRDGEQSALTIHYIVGAEQAQRLPFWLMFPLGIVGWAIAETPIAARAAPIAGVSKR